MVKKKYNKSVIILSILVLMLMFTSASLAVDFDNFLYGYAGGVKDPSLNEMRDVYFNDPFVYCAVNGDGIATYRFNGSSFTLYDSIDSGGDYLDICTNDNGTYIFTAAKITGQKRIYSYYWDRTLGGSITLKNSLDIGSDEESFYDLYYNESDSTLFCVAENGGLYAFTYDNLTGLTYKANKYSPGCNGYNSLAYDSGVYFYVHSGNNFIEAWTYNGTNFTLVSQDSSYWMDPGYSIDYDGSYIYVGTYRSFVYEFTGSSFIHKRNNDQGINYHDCEFKNGCVYWADGSGKYWVYSNESATEAYTFLKSFDGQEAPMKLAWGDYLYGAETGGLYAYYYYYDDTSNFVSSAPGDYKIYISWDYTKVFSDSIIIIYNTTSPAEEIINGTQIYNGTGSSCSMNTGTAIGMNYYFSVFGYNSSLNRYVYFSNFSQSTINDTSAPYATLSGSCDYGEGVTNGTFNLSVLDDYEGTVETVLTINDEIFYYNLSVDGINFTYQEDLFNLSAGNLHSWLINVTDSAGNSAEYTGDLLLYNVTLSFINERDGTAYDWTNAKTNGNLTGCSLWVPEKQIFVNLYVGENVSYQYASSDPDTIRINCSYADTESSIIRSFGIDLLDNNARIGLVEEETLFYAQLIYSAQERATVVENVHSDCYILTGYTDRGYEDFYSIQAVTIDMLYYIYTYSEGNKIYLASLEGSIPSNINLEFLAYENLSSDFSLLTEGVFVSQISNTTLKIYYANLKENNLYVNIKLFDGDNLIFRATEFESPNEITIYFDYSTFTLDEDLLSLRLTITREDGTVDIISKSVTHYGAVALISAAMAAILAISIGLFGLTLASSKSVFGYFGIITIFIALGVTTLCSQEWYITLIQAVNIVLLVIIVLIYKNENPTMV